MQLALDFVPGVECTHIDIHAQTATVFCESGCDRQALIAALERRGYSGTIGPAGAACSP